MPVPVCAWPITSRPCEQRRDRLLLDRARRLVADVVEGLQEGLGQAEVGEGRHSTAELRRSALGSSTSLPRRAPRLRGPRARGGPRTADRSRPRRPAARRARPGRTGPCSGSTTICSGRARQWMSQNPIDRRGCAHAGAPVRTSLLLARGDPVGDEAPERGERRRATRRTRARRPSRSTTSTGSPVVGLDAARRRGPRASTSTAASAPSSSASSRLSSLEAVAITRPAPNGRAELDGERADAAGRGVDDDGLARARAAPTSCTGATRSGPGSAAPARRRRSTPSGIGNVVGRRRGGVLGVAAVAGQRDHALRPVAPSVATPATSAPGISGSS